MGCVLRGVEVSFIDQIYVLLCMLCVHVLVARPHVFTLCPPEDRAVIEVLRRISRLRLRETLAAQDVHAVPPLHREQRLNCNLRVG